MLCKLTVARRLYILSHLFRAIATVVSPVIQMASRGSLVSKGREKMSCSV